MIGGRWREEGKREEEEEGMKKARKGKGMDRRQEEEAEIRRGCEEKK